MRIYTEDGVERPLLRNEVEKKKVEMVHTTLNT